MAYCEECREPRVVKVQSRSDETCFQHASTRSQRSQHGSNACTATGFSAVAASVGRRATNIILLAGVAASMMVTRLQHSRFILKRSTIWFVLLCSLVGLNVSILYSVFPTIARVLWTTTATPAAYPTSHKVSVVVMNHNRPNLLLDSTLLRSLSQHSSVDEIMLLHSNPKSIFGDERLQLPKLQHIDATALNEDLGLAMRFHYCEHAKQDWVLIVDDDIEFEPIAIDQILFAMEQNPHRIIGRYGRTLDTNGQYRLRNAFGYVEVILTKFMIVERDVCQAFGKYRYLMDDITKSSTPKWNGEDIFLNLVANHIYKVPSDGPFTNLAIRELPVWDSKLDQSYVQSVSGNPTMKGIWNFFEWTKSQRQAKIHKDHRSIMWREGKERLASLR